MQPHSFDYVRPQTLAKAIQVLSENGDRAKVLAGGQSLIPVLNLRLANPRVLLNINDRPGLAFVEERGDRLRIGAWSRHRDFEQSKLIRAKYPIFSDVASVLGDPQVRTLGTIGGALAHADPASDWGTALLALEAELIARGPTGARTIPIDRFFKDPFTTALRSSELLTEIRVPRSKSGDGGAYLKLKRKTGDFATIGVAVQLGLDAKRNVAGGPVGLAAVRPAPSAAPGAGKALIGRKAGATAVAGAAELASEEGHPPPHPPGRQER